MILFAFHARGRRLVGSEPEAKTDDDNNQLEPGDAPRHGVPDSTLTTDFVEQRSRPSRRSALLTTVISTSTTAWAGSTRRAVERESDDRRVDGQVTIVNTRSFPRRVGQQDEPPEVLSPPPARRERERAGEVHGRRRGRPRRARPIPDRRGTTTGRKTRAATINDADAPKTTAKVTAPEAEHEGEVPRVPRDLEGTTAPRSPPSSGHTRSAALTPDAGGEASTVGEPGEAQ